MGPQIIPGGERTIAAVSTPPGAGGVAMIRLSGADALDIFSRIWKGADLGSFDSHTAHLGWITDRDGREIDQVVALLYKSPNSYTGEDVVEITCHGSPWIQKAIVNRLIESGASAAGPGEFTRRAFVNGRLDLAQAEGVADIIASTSEASARLAASQLKGDFSKRLKGLRDKLIDLGSLLELELDFSEEDVEFADRSSLTLLGEEILQIISRLADSFRSGNAFKNGIPVAISGIPNAGKSTLLNALTGEEKAIVSDIPGTTRDVIEDTVEIGGILFRFYDTAGLRESDDAIESIGVEKARKKMAEAFIVLRLLDPTKPLAPQLETFESSMEDTVHKPIILNVLTKKDLNPQLGEDWLKIQEDEDTVTLSAATGEGLDELKDRLKQLATRDFNPEQELVVTNARHYGALCSAKAPLMRMMEGLGQGLSADFLAQDLREAGHYLGAITGEVTSDNILHTIFARYCIGK